MPYRMAIPCLVAENLVMNQQREIFDLQLLLNLHFSPQEGIRSPCLFFWYVKKGTKYILCIFQSILSALSLILSI